jgi:hypothetical protein
MTPALEAIVRGAVRCARDIIADNDKPRLLALLLTPTGFESNGCSLDLQDCIQRDEAMIELRQLAAVEQARAVVLIAPDWASDGVLFYVEVRGASWAAKAPVVQEDTARRLIDPVFEDGSTCEFHPLLIQNTPA